ncbi:uncharacterized protein LOC142982561 [Anticarsia gemmatalis]|uniref:uncharacterized protein LOC142982561 n=1 Tax=Anticarsia gemmatalis TaxID=129554 RepID=UPI003F777DC5
MPKIYIYSGDNVTRFEIDKFETLSSLSVPWKWVLLYIVLVVIILSYNQALKMSTCKEFAARFKSLLNEMSLSSVFRPCGYPIELVSRLCMDNLEKPRMVHKSSSSLPSTCST